MAVKDCLCLISTKLITEPLLSFSELAVLMVVPVLFISKNVNFGKLVAVPKLIPDAIFRSLVVAYHLSAVLFRALHRISMFYLCNFFP